MKQNTQLSPLVITVISLVALLALLAIGWGMLKSLPSRYLSRLPSVVQELVIPEPESAVLPSVVVTVDTDALLAAPIAAADSGATLPSPVVDPSLPTATPTLIPLITKTPTPVPTSTPIPTATPSALPASVRLNNVAYHQQDWNNCGPATLAMALSSVGGNYTQYDAAAILKPNAEDRNVSPSEMAAFVNEHTPYRAISRVNGSLDMLKQLLANGFPIIIEIGDRAPTEVAWLDSEPGVAYRDWWGHYVLAAGYDEAVQQLWVYDALIWDILSETNTSNGIPMAYDELFTFWPQFNRSYIVVFPPERESEVAAILGEDIDHVAMWRRSLESNQLALQNQPDNPFLWFNLGSSYNALGQHEQAAAAFDKARTVGLPWRMLWYQFAPYEAYFNVGRYDDVILLANTTLTSRPYFEESFYWRGRAQAAMGNNSAARADFQRAIDFNPYFTPAVDALSSVDNG